MIQQPKVATNTGVFCTKQQAIYNYLKEHPEGSSPKMIAFATSINHNTVKTLMLRMKNLERVTRGWYKVSNGGDGTPKIQPSDTFSWTFQNCILSSEIEWNHQQTKPITIDTGLIRLSCNLYNFKLLQLVVAADPPICLSALTLVVYLFQNLSERYSIVVPKPENILVKTIEFQKDFTKLRLDGIEAISVRDLIQQFKTYQKKQGLRVEHKTRAKFNAEDVLMLMHGATLDTETETRLKEQTRRIESLTKTTEEILSKLAIKL